MRVHWTVVLAGLLGLLALLPARQAASAPTGDLAAALQRTRALQDAARVLRNGATAGADADVLAAEAARLRADLEALVTSHQQWAASLPDAHRAAVAPHFADVESGCARMRGSLDDLDRTLQQAPIDRETVQSVGQSIGRQARLCGRALRRAQRG